MRDFSRVVFHEKYSETWLPINSMEISVPLSYRVLRKWLKRQQTKSFSTAGFSSAVTAGTPIACPHIRTSLDTSKSHRNSNEVNAIAFNGNLA